ncbi:MAG: hypothetical protein AAGB02_02195 [Pseudomonadota bacterium]
MIRVLLPAFIVISMFFTPFFTETTSGSATGERVSQINGAYFIDEAFTCLRNLQFADIAFSEDCASDANYNDSTMAGAMLSGAAKISMAAAVIGIIGLLPLIGRLTSIVTIIAGLSTLAAVGYFAMSAMGTPEGLASVQWGAYLTGGLGLLTLISGLSGIRGD